VVASAAVAGRTVVAFSSDSSQPSSDLVEQAVLPGSRWNLVGQSFAVEAAEDQMCFAALREALREVEEAVEASRILDSE
jgi:hypothetical protein